MVTALASHRRSPKTEFLDESRQPIRTRTSGRDDGLWIATNVRASRSRHSATTKSSRRDDAVAPGDDEVVPLRDAQMPSFAFRRSFTACGLALPPDDFITWPTNQPASCGLAFACATLSGLADMMSSITF